MDDKQRIALVETRTLDTAGNDEALRQLIRYQLGNHLGSASLELDEQAQIISYEEYAPYGSSTYQAVRSQTETAKRYRYTGKERDEESGLYYHVTRYYVPWLGRWTSYDPLGMVDNSNLYLYVSNNPIVFMDPTGMQEVPSATDIQKWIEAHPQRAAELAGAPLTDEALHQAIVAEMAKDQRQEKGGKSPSQAVDARCRPLQISPKAQPKSASDMKQYFVQSNEPYDRRHRYIKTPVDDPLQYEMTEVYATPEEAEEMQKQIDMKEASDRAGAALAAAAGGGPGSASRAFVENAGSRPGAPVGRPRTESANPVRANPWFGNTRPEPTVPDTLPYRRDTNRDIANRGGIVWTSPQTLSERIALQAALSGEGEIAMKGPFGDPKYQGEGWVKMQYVTHTADGNKIEIHYMRNTVTGQTDQFKFVSRGEYKKPTADPKVSSGTRP